MYPSIARQIALDRVGAPGRTIDGSPLTPGHNVDPVNIGAGLELAATFGYGDAQSQMVIEYALMRQKRGEESGAERTALNGGIALTSWYAIRAAAIASADG